MVQYRYGHYIEHLLLLLREFTRSAHETGTDTGKGQKVASQDKEESPEPHPDHGRIWESIWSTHEKLGPTSPKNDKRSHLSKP